MSHINYKQRYIIELLLSKGESKASIARILSVNRSIIGREITRNCDGRSKIYKADLAEKKYQLRLHEKLKHVRLTAEIKLEIITYLKADYSPEQITGVLKRDGKKYVSPECIYQFIWKDKLKKGDLHTHLRRKGRRNKKRGAVYDSRSQILNRINISQRPKHIELRNEFGHFELDLVIGKNHQGALITLNERASGMAWLGKVESKEAEIVNNKLMEMLEEIRPFVKTITSDNGKEFALHQKISDQYCDYYFADPYSPWQRGSNENYNGLVRQYVPKSSDILSLSNERILEIQNKLNNRPRKRYGYQSPIFVMEKLLFNQDVAFVA